MRRLFGLASLAALVLLPRAADAASQPLFVELLVNGRSTGEIVPLRLADGRMFVSADVLREAGLIVNGEGDRDVAHMPGLDARYDAGLQTLTLAAAPDLLPVSHIAGEARAQARTVADWGAMLNYDAYAQRAGGATSASLWTEQRLFGPLGVLSNDGTIRLASAHDAADGYLRYDTYYRYVDENRALAFTAGDFITQSLPWSTSVRIGGLQIGRDFRVRPDLLTMPLPSFAGKAAVPSTVDLFVNGYRQQSSDVAPGRFVLDNIPVVTGAGQATIVTTDAVGRQVATTVPFYVSSALLKPGLVDFSGEVGFLRRDYGLRSFGYGALAASGTIRRGMTGTMTLEAHGEASGELALLGMGLVWTPGRLGTVSLSGGASHTGDGTDARWSAGYEYASRRFSIAVRHDEFGRGYRDLGSLGLADYAGPRRSDRVVASVNLPGQGSLAGAYIGGETLDGARSRIGTLSYSRPLAGRASLFLSADRDFARGRTSAQLRLVVPFGRNSIDGGVSQSPGRGALVEADYARSMPSAGGVGIDANLAGSVRGEVLGQGTVTWRLPAVQLQAGGAFAGSARSAWLGATGTLVTLDRDVFASNQVSDAFAVVATGARGIGVSYENQRVGTTDASGHLFVPNVVAYLPARFTIDTLSLDASHVAAAVERRVAFRQGTGALVRMPVRIVRAVTLVLLGADGVPLAAGSRVARAGAPDTEVGWDGIAYLEDVADRIALTVTRGDGTTCHAGAAIPADAESLADLGRVPCV